MRIEINIEYSQDHPSILLIESAEKAAAEVLKHVKEIVEFSAFVAPALPVTLELLTEDLNHEFAGFAKFFAAVRLSENESSNVPLIIGEKVKLWADH